MQMEFKIVVLAYKALNNLAPRSLSDDCQLVAVTSRRQLRSSHNFKCTIISKSSHLGDRAFAAAGPRLCNNLHAHVLQPDLTLDSFYRKVKTHLTVRDTSACTVKLLFSAAMHKFTYLIRPTYHASV